MKPRKPPPPKTKFDHDWKGKFRPDNRMRYEKPTPMTFVAGDAYAASSIWKACDVCGKECMGEDGLAEHIRNHKEAP